MSPSPSASPSSSTTTSMPALPGLTLIVATTPSLGIGLRGSLPWPALKSDLAFFARVTKRPPPPYPTPSAPPSSIPDDASPQAIPKAINAVIMGRKTWDSIPPRFRPLKGRINVVISRDKGIKETLGKSDGSGSDTSTKTMGASSLTDAILSLQSHYGSKDSIVDLGRIFVIGGASIYEQAKGMECCERILWTRIRREFECDLFFPGQDVPGPQAGNGKEAIEWRQKSKKELREWCGEENEGVGEVQREGDVEFEVQMWERVRNGEGGRV